MCYIKDLKNRLVVVAPSVDLLFRADFALFTLLVQEVNEALAVAVLESALVAEHVRIKSLRLTGTKECVKLVQLLEDMFRFQPGLSAGVDRCVAQPDDVLQNLPAIERWRLFFLLQ